MYLGYPTGVEWREIYKEHRPYDVLFSDWVMWSFDLDPMALNMQGLRQQMRDQVTSQLTLLLDTRRDVGIYMDEGIEWGTPTEPGTKAQFGFNGWWIKNRMNSVSSPVRKWAMQNRNRKGDDQWGANPVPVDQPIKGLVKSAKKVFPDRLWKETPYDVRRFAEDQGIVIARAEVDGWQEEVRRYWDQDWNRGVFPDYAFWYRSMFRVFNEMAKWLKYDPAVWYGAGAPAQKAEVDNALRKQAYSAMVRAQTEQRYIPQPTSFEAPVLPRIPGEVERGEFGAERIKTYLPFVGIGIGLFRVFKG